MPKNGSRQGQNLTLTVLFVPSSLNSGNTNRTRALSGRGMLPYRSSGQGVIFHPPQVLGSYVCPTAGAYRLLATEGTDVVF